MKQILWLIGLSIILQAAFIKERGIVKDSATKLEWQDDNITDKMKWQDALNYCEGLTLEGYTDWRLPNINELKTIIDRSRYNPAIVLAFEHTSFDNYWSSTTDENYHEYDWFVNFSNGYVEPYHKNATHYVRCVRDGQ